MPSSQNLIDKSEKLRKYLQSFEQRDRNVSRLPNFSIYEEIDEKIYLDCINATLSLNQENQGENLNIIASCFTQIRDTILAKRAIAPAKVPFYYNLHVFLHILDYLHKDGMVDITPIYLLIKNESQLFRGLVPVEWRSDKIIRHSLNSCMKYVSITGETDSVKNYLSKIYLKKDGKLLRLENNQLIFDNLLEHYVENYQHNDNAKQSSVKEVLDFLYDKSIDKVNNVHHNYNGYKTNILKEIISRRKKQKNLAHVLKNLSLYLHIHFNKNKTKEEKDQEAIILNKEVLVFIQDKIENVIFIKKEYPSYFDKALKSFEHENFVNQWIFKANIDIYKTTLLHHSSNENYFLSFIEKQKELLKLLNSYEYFQKYYIPLIIETTKEVYFSKNNAKTELRTDMLQFLEFTYNQLPNNEFLKQLEYMISHLNKNSLNEELVQLREKVYVFIENKKLSNLIQDKPKLTKKPQKI